MKKGMLTAEARAKGGKGVSARLRRDGRIPGVLYGAGADPVSVSLQEKDVQTALKTGVRILDLKVGADAVTALLKDVAYDHLGEKLIHVDFLRLRKGEAVEIRIPLTYKGSPVGAKEGGVFNVLHDTLLVSCQPEDMPEHVEIDVAELKLGESLHVRDVKLPKGVTATEGAEVVIAVVTYSDKEVEAVAAVPEEAVATQPEVIGEAERKAREEAKAAEEAAAGGASKEKKKEEKKG